MPSILQSDGAPALLPTSPHVPAWKRLGLKLKFAKDIPEPEIVPTTPETPKQGKREKKRKREGVAAPATAVKISKTASSTNIEPSKSSISTSPSPNSPRNHRLSQSPEVQPTPKPTGLKRQKSVSFTPETKAKDGESVKQLFSSWVDEQKAADANFDPESIGAALRTPVAPVIIATTEAAVTKHTTQLETQPKGKKEKKKKRPKPSPTDSVPYIPPHLVYLEQHHSLRSAWKFNKAKQSHLLKHLFDFTQVPSEYDQALRGYMVGLQGEAVRARVVEAANRVVSEDKKADAAPEDEEGGSSEMADRDRIRKAAEHQDALQTHVQAVTNQALATTPPDPAGLSPSMRQRVRKRAETILLSLAQSAPPSTTPATRTAEPDRPAATTKRIKLDPSSSSQPSPRLEPPAQGRRRNRKQRTNGASDDETSDDDDVTSSSGSSETDSSSSSEGESTSGSGSDSGSDDSEDSSSANEGEETSSSSSSSSSSDDEQPSGR